MCVVFGRNILNFPISTPLRSVREYKCARVAAVVVVVRMLSNANFGVLAAVCSTSDVVLSGNVVYHICGGHTFGAVW